MNSEDVIDRVLAGLAGVEAEPAIEGRVLQAIKQRAAAREVKDSPRFIFRPLAIAAGVLLLTIAGSIVVHKRQEPRHEQAVLKPHTSPIQVTATETPAVLPGARPQNSSPVIPIGNAIVARPEPLSDEEALAIEEMNAPSRPAPPLPLSRQEKLLAEAAHPDSAIELSSLRPEVRAQQMELSKAEFHAFFDPPPIKDNE